METIHVTGGSLYINGAFAAHLHNCTITDPAEGWVIVQSGPTESRRHTPNATALYRYYKRLQTQARHPARRMIEFCPNSH